MNAGKLKFYNSLGSIGRSVTGMAWSYFSRPAYGW